MLLRICHQVQHAKVSNVSFPPTLLLLQRGSTTILSLLYYIIMIFHHYIIITVLYYNDISPLYHHYYTIMIFHGKFTSRILESAMPDQASPYCLQCSLAVAQKPRNISKVNTVTHFSVLKCAHGDKPSRMIRLGLSPSHHLANQPLLERAW